MEGVQGETAQTLIAAAAERGGSVSSAMLAKWRAAGLLPRPVQRSLGRAHGTVTVYPDGSTAQLLRLLTIRAEPGRFDPERALWRLWWEGWPVDAERVRALLAKVLDAWEGDLVAFQDGDGAILDAFETGRLPSLLAKTRKRAGTAAMPTVAALVLGALAGEAPESWQDDDDGQALLRALGFAGAIRGLGPAEARRFTADLAGTLRRFGLAVSPAAMRDALDSAGSAGLSMARADLRSVVTGARVLWRVIAPTLPESTTGRDLLDAPNGQLLEMLPGAVLVVLALGRVPAYRRMLDALRTAAAVAESLSAVIESAQPPTTQTPPRRSANRPGAPQEGSDPDHAQAR